MASKSPDEAQPEGITEERPKEMVEERPKEVAEERPKEVAEERPKEVAEERPKEMTEERPKEVAEEKPKETTEERPKEVAEERPEEMAEERPKEVAEERPKEMTEERPKEIAEEKPNEIAEGRPKESTEERPKEIVEETTTEPDATDLGRPHLFHGTSSQMDTQYVHMLLALDKIPRTHNMLAGLFTWILLAGFMFFPGTFTSLQNNAVLNGSTVGKEVLDVIAHAPLYVIGWVCCVIGAVGMLLLWWRWRNNYIWVLNKIFVPGLLNSLAGLLSTLVNAFGVQHGTFSKTAKVTVILTSAIAFVCGLLVLVYSLWVVRRMQVRHDREVGERRAGRYGEGRVERLRAKVEQEV